uniref:Uncharacterized protein n=1 Tax=Ovis aries TaxID=9940 RepID=A0AC11D6Q1_SHEEP
MKPAVDEMFPEGAGPYVDLDEAGGSTGLLMDLAANEKAVHADFFNDAVHPDFGAFLLVGTGADCDLEAKYGSDSFKGSVTGSQVLTALVPPPPSSHPSPRFHSQAASLWGASVSHPFTSTQHPHEWSPAVLTGAGAALTVLAVRVAHRVHSTLRVFSRLFKRKRD